MSINNLLFPNNLCPYIKCIENDIDFHGNVQIDGNLNVDGTITGDITPSQITPGMPEQLLFTNSLGTTAEWKDFELDNIPHGTPGQLQFLVSTPLDIVEWQSLDVVNEVNNDAMALNSLVENPGSNPNIIIKGLEAGSNITITDNNNNLLIDASNDITQSNLGSGEFILSNPATASSFSFKSLIAGDSIGLTSTANDITINSRSNWKSVTNNTTLTTIPISTTGNTHILTIPANTMGLVGNRLVYTQHATYDNVGGLASTLTLDFTINTVSKTPTAQFTTPAILGSGVIHTELQITVTNDSNPIVFRVVGNFRSYCIFSNGTTSWVINSFVDNNFNPTINNNISLVIQTGTNATYTARWSKLSFDV